MVVEIYCQFLKLPVFQLNAIVDLLPNLLLYYINQQLANAAAGGGVISQCTCMLTYVQLHQKLNTCTVIAKKVKVLFSSNRGQKSNTDTMQPDTTLLTLDPLPCFWMTTPCTHTGWACRWNVSTNWSSQTDGGGHTILLISTFSKKYPSSFGWKSDCLLGLFWWMFRH